MDKERCLSVHMRARLRLLSDKKEFSLFRENSFLSFKPFAGFAAEHAVVGQELSTFLLNLEKKIDYLVASSLEKKIEDFFSVTGVVTSIGLNNLSCACLEPLAPGDFLECVLFLREFPTELLPLRVCVAAQLGAFDANPRWTQYIFSLCEGGEEEKERLIQFIFQEERRELRRQKGE